MAELPGESYRSGGEYFSRRAILGAIGAATTTVAGCIGGGGPAPLDSKWSLPLSVDPGEARFNPFAPVNRTGMGLLYEPLARFDPVASEWTPVLASDWNVNDEAIRLTLADDREWSNGDQVTADDVTSYLTFLGGTGDPIADLFEDWKTIDKREAVLRLPTQGYNPRLALHRLLPHSLMVNRSALADHIERAKDVTSASDREEFRERIYELPGARFPTNGPFTVEEVRDSSVQYSPWDQHPRGTELRFDGVEQIHLPSRSEQWQALREGTIDGHDDLRLSPERRESLPDRLSLVETEGLGGNALFIQYDDEWLGRPRVRRAIGHILDGAVLAAQVDGVPVYESDGTGPYRGINNKSLLDTWFKGTKGLTTYDAGKEKAETLLSDAGLTKQDGIWTTPGGDPVRAPIKVAASWGVGSVIAQEIATQLRSAGIPSEVVRQGINSFRRDWRNGEYRFAFTSYGFDWWHPFAHYSYAFGGELNQTSWNYPERVSIRAPPGDTGRKVLTPRNLLERLRRTQSVDRARSLVRTLGWVFNQTLPWIPSNKNIYSVLLTNDQWKYPSVSQGDARASTFQKLVPSVATQLPVVGELEPKFKSG